jgi:hypothetical protein
MQEKITIDLRVYASLFILLILLRGLDLYVTYRITPDLSREWNPLVSGLGFDWFAFILVQLLVIGLAIVGYHYFHQRERRPVPKPGLGLTQFIYYYFNEREMSLSHWWRSHFRRPGKRYFDAHLAFIGFVITLSVVLVSIFAIAHNLAVWAELDAYSAFLFEYADIYFFSVFVLLVAISAKVFFVMEYAYYRRSVPDGS